MLQYREFTPSEGLREYVECYWTLQTDISLEKELCLPDGSASLIFNFGPPYFRAIAPEPSIWEKIGNCSMPHQGKECVLISQERPVRLLGVRFKPYGMAPFFNVSMPDFNPPFVIHGEALNVFLGDLEKKLCATELFEERITILEDDFSKRLPGLAPPDELVKAAVRDCFKTSNLASASPPYPPRGGTRPCKFVHLC